MKAVTRESSQPQLSSSAEDEALKKNTDCVYFLASPLTCKKGNDCEYRHSEEARMNPTDCWFWLNGNCLNPKCSFRHPPLDGLVGSTVGTSAKPSLPPSLPVASTPFSAANTSAYNPAKQSTPCYYFQKGLCLKGDRCAFMHGSQPMDNMAPQPPPPKIAAPVTEPQTFKKLSWGLENCNQQKIFQQDVTKPVQVPRPVKPHAKAVVASLQNGATTEKYTAHVSMDNELSRYKAANAPSIISGNSVDRAHRGRQIQTLDDRRNFQNGKEPDEFLGESSPGFDVLVDDEVLEPDYYEAEDYGRRTGHGGRHVDVIDHGRSADYSPVAKFDRETYSDVHGYDTYGRAQDRYAREQCRGSSERLLDRSSVPERRGLPRVESPEHIDELDLRYRLSKQRRSNGPRSAVSSDSRGNFYRKDERGRHVEDPRYQGHTRRDPRYTPQESSISNRLQGRISLPGRSSPDRNRNDYYLEKENDRGRKYPRLSPGKPPLLSHPGRPQDRLRRRIEDEFNPEGRSFRAPFIRREESDDPSSFAGPKRLVELKKGAKISERGEDQHSRGIEERKNTRIRKFESHQDLEGSTSFEGPKPLTEILKRKRQEKTDVSEDDGREDDNQKERGRNSQTVDSDKHGDLKGKPSDQLVSPTEEPSFPSADVNGTVDQYEEEEEEGMIHEEVEAQPSAHKGSEPEAEDMIMLNNAEDEEFETSDQRDAESDYEQVDGDFKTEEDENPEAEEEYFDEEEDDFAKRIGVMFT